MQKHTQTHILVRTSSVVQYLIKAIPKGPNWL